MAVTQIVDHRFPYKWYLKDGYPAKGIEPNGCKVFGTFICGGGSSMGYKLSGFDHLGGVEIDKKIAVVYKLNHNPKYLFTEDIRLFNQRKDLPEELYNLDLLDGSPPCSSFSMSGNREKDWGKEKVFNEGQAKQTLDDLVFEYVKTIKMLQPKVALLENVKGLIQGNAKAYARKLKSDFERAGYKVQVFLLNAASMGVPQIRERVFFIGLRANYNLPELYLKFNEKPILFGSVQEQVKKRIKASPSYEKYWKIANKMGRALTHKNNTFGYMYRAKNNLVLSTILAGTDNLLIDQSPHKLTNKELILCGSFPQDFNFLQVEPKYLIGMSVPPIMTAQISHQIYEQWLSKM